jgi:flagellar L-ring protein precursor FlgH
MRAALLIAVGSSLCGCAAIERMARPPEMSAPGAPREALPSPAAARLVTPPKDVASVEATAGSLWRSGPDSLFGDRRARRQGDIVTVLIEIDDRAEIRNSTSRDRDNEESVSVPALFGVETLATKVLSSGAGLDPAVEASSSSSSSGDGEIKRREKIMLRVAATVVAVLPNGHLAIQGSQEVRVNNELRDLQVVGIVRPEDISRVNVITYDRIADARISYGGRGVISDVQRVRYGQQVLDLVSPF